MSHILYRESLGHALPVAVAGDGPYLIDAAVSCLGHSNEAVRKAIREQADQLAFAHSRFFTTEAAERLADDLVSGAPAGLTKVWLTCGGSESVEAALKLTRQYFVESGQPQRTFVIARRQALSRQHVRRLVGERQYLAPPPVRAGAHQFDAAYLAVLRLPLQRR